jgi:FkbM family methyltransferase
MPFPLGARRVKQLVAPLIPERIKARFRARLFGYRPTTVACPVEFSSDDGGPSVVIDGDVRLRYRDEDRNDFRYHLCDNGESIEELASFIALGRSARTVFDVGAWKGLFSIVFCALGRDKRAVAYEPSSLGVSAIAELARQNGCADRLTIVPAAVGLSSGRITGRIAPSGIISLGADRSGGDAVDDLPIVSLDDEVRRTGLVPDLLKIDVEGYEHEVIAGARQLLREHKPAICLELHLDLLERRGLSPALVIAELESHGYRFRSCAGPSLTARQLSHSMHAVLRFVAV